MAKKRLPIKDLFMDTALVTGGSLGGTMISDGVEKALIKANKPNANKIAPWITTGIGIIGQIFAPPKLKIIFLGMTSISLTESAEKLIEGKQTITIPPPTSTAPVQGLRQQPNMQGLRQRPNVSGYRKY